MQAQANSTVRPHEAKAMARAAMGTFLLLLCIPAANAAIPHPHRQPRQVVHIIEKLEGLWQQAELTANTATMQTMLSENYLGIYGDGTLATKAETIESFRSRKTRFTRIRTWDRKIRVFGRTAVVVSKAEVVGVHDGENISGLYRYTRVYHRHNGVWKIVSFEASAAHPRGHKNPPGPRPAPGTVPR